MAFVHAFFLIGKRVAGESLDVINSCPALFTNSGRILRRRYMVTLMAKFKEIALLPGKEPENEKFNLLVSVSVQTQKLRGDDASSLSCYMEHDRNSSENDACDHIRLLIDNSWQKLDINSL